MTKEVRRCSVEGCEGKHWGKGLCAKHHGAAWEATAHGIWSRAKAGAKKRGIAWHLDEHKYEILARLNALVCERSFLPLTFASGPWRVSIDRIDSSKPYALDNIRIVAWLFNTACNDFGEQPVANMVAATHDELPEDFIPPQAAKTKLPSQALNDCRREAKKRGLDYDLDAHREDIYHRIAAPRCEATGMPISLSATKPYRPSIDRIDSSKGEMYGNIRITSVVWNFACGDWGEEPVRQFAEAYSAARLWEKLAAKYPTTPPPTND